MLSVKKVITKGSSNMKKEKCIICLNAKGKRVCKINDNSIICPICCAKIRTSNCDGCIHYTKAEKYAKEKSLKQKSQKFIMTIDYEIDKKMDIALAMVEKGDIQSGESIISALLNDHSHVDMVQYGMGVVCSMKKQYGKAITYFDKAIKINPYFVEAWFNKGAAHQKRLELGDTIKAYQKVIEFGDPSEHFVVHAKGFIVDLAKNIKKSIGLTMNDYLKSMDTFTDAYTSMERMDWEKALSGFRKVLSMNPQHTQSYSNIGICYGQLGKKQEALAALEKALELDPEYEPAIINLKVISSLANGEKLPSSKFMSVDYYKDIAIKNKSNN